MDELIIIKSIDYTWYFHKDVLKVENFDNLIKELKNKKEDVESFHPCHPLFLYLHNENGPAWLNHPGNYEEYWIYGKFFFNKTTGALIDSNSRRYLDYLKARNDFYNKKLEKIINE